ncbi:MAG: rod shape-determining protein MreC [Edaphobacter sp.]|uniref:rod shape-determining protein MreC n=1 Tax=Edaphobacter sp. TaxID=1934404 RepID=UPI0023A53C0E|nr:rod shape-determining protein MreC [Edaphobacter sp.]MDE1177870.1 rod shape-determining protein MreC [Edaphobacter sp.]
MESFFTRFKNVLVLVTVLLVQTIGLAIQVRRPVDSGAPDSPKVRMLRSWVIGVVTPFERFFHGIGHNVRYGWSDYIDLRNTRQQNHDLQSEVARLRLEQSELAEDARQGHRLQALLNFQQHYVTSTVAAQVIGASGTDQSRVLYIDKGSNDGLKVDQAVITPDGIVGKLREVQSKTAQVLVINDQSSGAGVLLTTTRIRAILRGTSSGRIIINNLTPDSRIKPGEQVITSGGDQIYPRGLPVGTIETIAPDTEHQPYTIIQLKPATNLFQLEEVLIITGNQTALPALAQKDLAQGLATAEQRAAAAKAAADEAAAEAAAQSAAQMVGEKLPSIHEAETDPNAPPGGTPAQTDAAKQTGVVPRPRPTQHPDRYTYGATPPASSLTPGAGHPSGEVAAPQQPARTPKPQSGAEPQTESPNN